MRRWIGRILAWFLRDYLVSDALVVTRDEHVQVLNATFLHGRWNVQVRVFDKNGRYHKTVFVEDLNEAALRAAAVGAN